MKQFLTERLMMPGPTNVPPAVALAGAKEMIGHRGGLFKKKLTAITEKIQTLMQTKNDVVILTSSGTGGMEAAVTSLMSSGDKALVASVGNFGKRFIKLLKQYGIEVEALEYEAGQAVDPAAVKAVLAKDTEKKIKAVFFQMNETSTAVINDTKAIAKAVKSHGSLVVVDAISGFLAGELKVDEWGLDVVITGSQKAYMIPPGLAMVAISKAALAKMKESDLPKFYFDLVAAVDKGPSQTPWTPAVGLILQLEASLDLMMAEGLDGILARHALMKKACRAGVRALGLELLVDDDKAASPAVTAVKAPAGIDGDELRADFREHYGLYLAGGQGALKGKIFRIGHLGWVDRKDLLATFACLEMTLSRMGASVEWGKGVQAVQDIFYKDEQK